MDTSFKGNQLVYITGGVMVLGTFAEKKYYDQAIKPKGGKFGSLGGSSTQKKQAQGVQVTYDWFKQLVVIIMVMVLLAITTDLAPEFGGPFTLLVLVAFIVARGKYIGYLVSGAQK